MSSDALAAAYGDGVRFRSHGISSWTDETLGRWLRDAREELRERRLRPVRSGSARRAGLGLGRLGLG